MMAFLLVLATILAIFVTAGFLLAAVAFIVSVGDAMFDLDILLALGYLLLFSITVVAGIACSGALWHWAHSILEVVSP